MSSANRMTAVVMAVLVFAVGLAFLLGRIGAARMVPTQDEIDACDSALVHLYRTTGMFDHDVMHPGNENIGMLMRTCRRACKRVPKRVCDPAFDPRGCCDPTRPGNESVYCMYTGRWEDVNQKCVVARRGDGR